VLSDALLPLDGVRVLDVTSSWAGPWCTKILGDLGADVIKVEAVQAYDLTRGPVASEDWRAYANRGAGRPYERADTFLKPNRNKRGITLNLKDARGADLFRRLAVVSDIVAENFAPGEMEKFGLGFDELRALNPRLVLLRMPAMGASGPERDYVGFGSTLEMLSGITNLTGYEGGPPMKSGFWYGDPISGVHAAAAVMMALLERDATGVGQIVEVAQVETLTGFAADALLQYAVNGELYDRIGNRDLGAAPQGCYPTREDDTWITLSVTTTKQWRVLATLMGRADWADDSSLGTAAGRRAHADEIDAAISVWSREREQLAAARDLERAGIAVAPVYSNRQIFEDEQVRARGFFEQVTHPVAGTHEYPGAAWLLDGERPLSRRPAPLLGEHNREVLGGLLGLDNDTMDALEADAVIGYAPLVAVWGG
jgi:crotonobetainyl-CoA:carnitine CoA-transferase CaiB-like acyl-CoA transferase